MIACPCGKTYTIAAGASDPGKCPLCALQGVRAPVTEPEEWTTVGNTLYLRAPTPERPAREHIDWFAFPGYREAAIWIAGEHNRLVADLRAARAALGSVLAVLNHDGGHRQEEVGAKQAADEGLAGYYALVRRADAAEFALASVEVNAANLGILLAEERGRAKEAESALAAEKAAHERAREVLRDAAEYGCLCPNGCVLCDPHNHGCCGFCVSEKARSALASAQTPEAPT